MSRPATGRRGLHRLREDMTGRDHSILGQVADLRLISARQIEIIHFPNEDHASALSAARSCRRVLERMVRDRLLIRLERRIGGVRAGSASYVYAIGPVGERILDMGGTRRRFREPSTFLALHTLAISQLVVDVTVASRQRRLEMLQVQTEPVCWRTHQTGYGAREIIKPDLFLAVGVGEYEHRWFLEVDLGTQHIPTVIRKCFAYEQYYRSGTEQAARDVFPRILWLMQHTERVEHLQTAIAADPRLTSELFVVTTTERAVPVLTGVQS